MKILIVNRRYYPSQQSPTDPPCTLVVLVEGDIGDYTAYCGHGELEWVARHGDKISFTEACCHFPTWLEKELYRE